MRRVLLPLVLFAALVAAAPSQVDQPAFRLQVVPASVYKVDDPGGSGTSSFVFNIAVTCSTDCELTPVSARVELSSAGSLVERQDWTADMLAKVKRRSYRIEPSTALASPTRAFTLPEAFDVRFYFRHPQALAIDAAAVRLTVADAKGRRAEQALTIPIGYYQQKTALTLPIRGKGVFGQDWITIAVKAGDRVATGQVVGRLGNSGDSFGPHLHYHLQSGPRLFEYPSLPFRFQDLDDPLSRGRHFEAK